MIIRTKYLVKEISTSSGHLSYNNGRLRIYTGYILDVKLTTNFGRGTVFEVTVCDGKNILGTLVSNHVNLTYLDSKCELIDMKDLSINKIKKEYSRLYNIMNDLT